MSSSFSGWWYTYPSEKYEFVSWDDYSQYMKKNMFQTTNHFYVFFFVRRYYPETSAKSSLKQLDLKHSLR